MDERQKIEERLAHLERIVEDLSDIVVEQGRKLDLAQRRLAALLAREAEREVDAGALPIADRKPPHW